MSGQPSRVEIPEKKTQHESAGSDNAPTGSRPLSSVDLQGGGQLGIGQPFRSDFDGAEHQHKLVNGRQIDVPAGQMQGSGRRSRTADETKRRAKHLPGHATGDKYLGENKSEAQRRADRWNQFSDSGPTSGQVVVDHQPLGKPLSDGLPQTKGAWALNAARFAEHMREVGHRVGVDAKVKIPRDDRQATGYHEAIGDEKPKSPKSKRRSFTLV